MNKVRPKAFIFENVKGLSDPRNQKALEYILARIEQAGYHAKHFVLNAYDYGVPQTRIRIYIIGFKDEKYFNRLQLPKPFPGEVRLNDVLDSEITMACEDGVETRPRWSLSCNEKGFNDYFLFNDLRNGSTTIHSWDIIDTTDREKHICYLLLRNRRKSDYGELDGNPLSLEHFKSLDASIKREELDTLVWKHILKPVEYLYEIEHEEDAYDSAEQFILSLGKENLLNVDNLKVNREVKKRKIDVHNVLKELARRKVIRCIETRYDFKNTKISTGLAGINRIFLPSSKIYPTLVASDTNDFVATEPIDADTIEEFRKEFMERVYRPRNYRRITQSEACRIQVFPDNYILPPTRPRWMKLIGNSVAVPVIKILANAVVGTGVFDEKDETDAVIDDKPVENSHDVLMYAIAPAYRKKTEYAGKLAIGVKDGVLNDVDYSAIGYIMFHYWSNKRATPYKLYSPPRLVSKHDIPDGYMLRMADGAEKFLLLEYEPYKPADIGAYNIMKVQRHGKVRYLPFVIHQIDINTIVNEVTVVRE